MKLTFNRNVPMANQTSLPDDADARAGLLNPPLSAAELSRRLQTTLEVERILDLFSGAIQWACPHDGFTYDHPAQGLHLSRGRLSRHTCSYNLTVEREEIGRLCLLRGRRFREDELQDLEKLLAVLVYPLRNGLLYRQAVTAAQTDPLTGLQNRAALEQLLPRELAALRRGQQKLALLVVDVDHFKQINDTLGHISGDRALQATARCLQRATRASDMLFRYGGEEFVAVLRGAGIEQARQAGERLRNALRHCDEIRAVTPGVSLTASIGVAGALPIDTAASLFERADRAMYAAKEAGRDRVEVAHAAA